MSTTAIATISTADLLQRFTDDVGLHHVHSGQEDQVLGADARLFRNVFEAQALEPDA